MGLKGALLSHSLNSDFGRIEDAIRRPENPITDSKLAHQHFVNSSGAHSVRLGLML
jgi:hypothetical protein